MDVNEHLKIYQKLVDEGLITQEEFEIKKQQLLEKTSTIASTGNSTDGLQAPITDLDTRIKAHIADSGSFAWILLGFFFPIIGLILSFCWRNTKPRCAKMTIIGTICGFGLTLICYAIVLLVP